MTLSIGALSVDNTREVYRRVMGLSAPQPALDNARNQTIHNLIYYLLLEEDLDPAENPTDGYTQAIGRIIRYVQPISASNLNMESSTSVEGLITVTNRYDSFSASEGDLLMVIRNGSEWSPVTAGNASQRHAIILGCLGGGYYSAKFVEPPMFVLPSETGTGSGSGGSDCDICDTLIDRNEENTGTGTGGNVGPVSCGSLQGPSRIGVTGTGESFHCYDPRLLTLPGGAHIIVADLGDKVDSLDTGTGTGTAVPQETLWMVLTGNYNLVGIPDRFYECCNGEPYLVRCDTYITEGVFCEGVQVDCPDTGT